MNAAALVLALQVGPADDLSPPATIEPVAAARLFVDTCWRGLREETRFSAAIQASPLGFASGAGERGQRHFRAGQANIDYRPGNCSLTVMFSDEAKATQYAERVSQVLGLRAPEFSWVADAFDTRAIHWRDVPIDNGMYRFRGIIVSPNRLRDPNGPVRAEIWLGYTTWRDPSQQ